MTSAEIDIHSVKPSPRGDGSFEITLAPKAIDPDQVYGAQLTVDTFTPTGTPTEHLGITYHDGILGDPQAGTKAMLEVYSRAQYSNEVNRQETRRAIRLGATGIAAANPHENEGTLWLLGSPVDQ